MTISDCRILYANQSSDEFGTFRGHIGTINTETNDEETTIIQSKNRFKDTWDFHGLEQSKPLQFKLTIIKSNGEFIDANDQRALKKWLCKDTFNWLQVEQDDISDVFYYCIITNPRPISVGAYTGGIEFTVTCNSGFAWSDLVTRTYVVNGTLLLDYNIFTDFDNYTVRPLVIIKPTVDGSVSIINNTTNQTVSIDDCMTTETIMMDSNKDILESSNGRVLLDSWSKSFLELVSGINKMELTGKFKMTLQYRLPIRVGG